MFGRTSLLKATALALPFSLAAAAAHAASIAETVQQAEELSTFAEAMEAAKFDQQLSGKGPYTVFAPTNQAFEQLPEGALDELMKDQAQLTRLLEHHVIEGKALAADDVLGQQSQVDTMSGDTLTVDGTSRVVLLVPTGLTIAKIGDQMVIEREGVAVSRRAIQVEDQGSGAGAGQEQPQGQQAQGQGQAQGQQTAASTPTAQGSDMPMTEHQQQALESQPAQEQRQTAAEGTADMPATEHQQQVLAEEEPSGEQQQSYEQAGVEGKPDLLREATVVSADIQADNGVIHVIDAVLLPQDVLKMLEARQGQN